VTDVRWKGKRTRAKRAAATRMRACAAFTLIECEVAERLINQTRESAYGAGFVSGQVASGVRIKQLAGGLSNVFLGPIGQAQLEAYEAAYKVVMAKEYTPPGEVQARALSLTRYRIK
jgi:hypothetical protein